MRPRRVPQIVINNRRVSGAIATPIVIRFNQSPRLSSHLLHRYRFNIVTLIVVFVSCLAGSVDSSLLISCSIALQTAPISVLFAIYRLRPDLSLLILPNVENATSTLRSWLDSFSRPIIHTHFSSLLVGR